MTCYLCRGRLGLRIGHDICPPCWRLRYAILTRIACVTKPRGSISA